MLPPGCGQLYWHVLLGGRPEVRALVSEAQRRLAHLPELAPTPHRWLHITFLTVGLTDEVTPAERASMVSKATRLVGQLAPITVTLERVLYHPEAVVIAAIPADALSPLLTAVQDATRWTIGRDGTLAHQPWIPHVTVAYSQAEQPAGPVIAALGWEVPACEVTISSITLVNQDGPEYLWNWHPLAQVPLGSSP